MKLAVIAPAAIPANTANSIQVMKMAQAYVRQGHDLLLLAPGESPQLAWPELAEHYGLTDSFPIQGLPSRRLFRGYDYAYRATHRAQEWGAELIHTRLPQAAAWAADNGIPTIFELHDLPSGRLGPRLLNIFIRARGAKALVVISQKLDQALRAKYSSLQNSDLLQVHPDAVDLEPYSALPTPTAARKQLGLPSAFTIGYTGSLYKGRGINLILHLAAKLPHFQFLLVGGRQSEVEALRAQIADQKLSNMSLVGFVPNARLPFYQAASDVLLMPYQEKVSASSGGDIAQFLSPMKMFEYLAAGRPILASDLSVLAEILNTDNAVILPATDPAKWMAALQKLEADKDMRKKYALAAKQTAATHTWQQRASRILASLSLDP